MRKWGIGFAFVVLLAGILPVLSAENSSDSYFIHKGDVVLFLGDSITAETKYFYKVYFDDIAKKYTDLVEGEKPKYDGKGWGTPALRFVNGGVSGDIAAGGLKRLPGLIDTHKPTVCVVCFGMNDRYKDRKNYSANMQAIVKKLKESKIRITILSSPCVYAGKAKDLQPFIKILGEIKDEAQKIAQDEGVLFADSYTRTAKIGESRDFTWGDGIHPNEEGHRAMADALQEVWNFGKPLAAGGTAPKKEEKTPSTAKPESKPEAKPQAPAKDGAHYAPGGEWMNVTNNAGGERWGYACVTSMACVPGKDEVIAGISEAGLWSSTDGGATWKALGSGGGDKIANRPYQFIFDPKDAKTWWVSGSYGAGLFKTTDGGQTFRRVGTLGNVDGIAVDLSDPERKTILAGIHEASRSLQSSNDGGKTWAKIGEALPANSNFSSDPIALDAKTFLVNTAGWKQNSPWGIYRTTDAGATWNKVADQGSGGPALVASDDTIYWGICWGGGMLKSTDKGQTWKKLDGPVKSHPIEMGAGKIAALGGNQIFVSEDKGGTWKPLGQAAPAKPSGITYCEARKCFYMWLSNAKKTPDAIYRLDLAP